MNMPQSLHALDCPLMRERRGNVAILVLNRPPLNLLDQALRRAIREQVELLGKDESVRAIVLTGGGAHFCAGANLHESLLRADPETARQHAENGHAMTKALLDCRKPLVAALEGVCLGGGYELALACDVRVAGRTSKVGLPEIHRNLWPGTGGMHLLVRAIGMGAARLMMLEGQPIDAQEALCRGLVDKVVPEGAALEAAVDWAARLGERSADAWNMIKQLTDNAAVQSFQDYCATEAQAYVAWYQTTHAQTGIRAFLDKKKSKRNQDEGKRDGR